MELFLAIWGATLSSLLAIVKLLEFRYGQGSMVDVSSDLTDPELLSVTVANLGKRRLRVRQVTLWFGNADSRSDLVSVRRDEVLGEGDQLLASFRRDELLAAAQRASLTPGHNMLLYAEIAFAGRRRVLRALHLPLPADPSLAVRASFVAANLFLGLAAYPPTRTSTGKFVR